MPSLPVYNLAKEKIGSIELDDAIFSAEIEAHLLNQVVRTQIARRFEWKTANSKTRTEVKGTRKKMYRQKGTGQARHGDAKAPIFVGGGKSHGPKPHRRTFKTNKAVMRKALISALSMVQKEDHLFIIDKMELPKHSTKQVATALKAFGLTSGIVVNGGESKGEQVFNRSSRNVRDVKQLRPEGVNVFDVLKYKNLLVSKKAIQTLTERLKTEKTEGPKDV